MSTASDPRLDPLVKVARDTGVAVVVGASVRQRPMVHRNLALLSFAPRPTVAYAKQHLWDAERADLRSPATAARRSTLDDWPLGLGICYDGCFPEHARAATDDGALAYVCPSAYLVGSEHRRDLYYAARAIDNGIYCVMAGLVGPCGSSGVQRRHGDLRPPGPSRCPRRVRRGHGGRRSRPGRHRRSAHGSTRTSVTVLHRWVAGLASCSA